VWRIDFEKPDAASFYVDAKTAEIKAVRTGLWRTFDFMWGLHIMDWSNRENFNSWWIKTVAALSVFFCFPSSSFSPDSVLYCSEFVAP